MATATIKIAIEAQTAALHKGFAEAKGAINQFSASVSGSMSGGMAKVAGAAAIAVAAYKGLKEVVEGAVAEMGRMAAMSETALRLGMTADSLTLLGYAAEQSGASQETLNSALEKMQNLIGEASAGSDTAAQAFGRLGLSVGELKGLSADQAFSAIAEQIQQMGSSSERTSAIVDIFGESGMKLQNVLAGGAEGLNVFGKEAESMGLLIGDARDKVDAAGDAINKMKRAWHAFMQQVAVLLAPMLEAIANAMAKITGTINRMFGNATGATASFKAYETSAKKAAITIDETMKSTEKSAAKSAEKIKESWRDIPKPQDWKTAGIGAATRGTAAGFSAVQEANRARQDDERRHRDMISWLAKIYQAQQENAIRVQAVSI